MLLGRAEYVVMNSWLRALVQRRIEAARLRSLGPVVGGGRYLEVGCGRGVGVEILLEQFGADAVDAFDADVRMVARATARLSKYGSKVRIWIGDARAIAALPESYDAVVDFGVLHHVGDWQSAVSEIARVLRPGGRFYAEEIMRKTISNPIVRSLFPHPRSNRFDADQFEAELLQVGLQKIARWDLGSYASWFVSCRPPV